MKSLDTEVHVCLEIQQGITTSNTNQRFINATTITILSKGIDNSESHEQPQRPTPKDSNQ